jgi:hypothetical protein
VNEEIPGELSWPNTSATGAGWHRCCIIGLWTLSPKGYQEISGAHLLDATTNTWGRGVLWSPPAFASRCVYVRNDKELICVSLAAE